MEQGYILAESIISKAAYELNKIYDSAGVKSPEDTEAYRAIEKALYALRDTEQELRYLSSPTKEGQLQEQSNGKFAIEYTDGTESEDLSCGSSLEIYDQEEGWQFGRVEAKDGQYYFWGDSRPFLYTGMRARKRITR